MAEIDNYTSLEKRIAKIVDPNAWIRYEGCISAWALRDQIGVANNYLFIVEESLEKAREILDTIFQEQKNG